MNRCAYAMVHIQVYGDVCRAIQDGEESYIALGRFLYSFRCEAIQLCEVTSIRLLLRIGIKVVQEWQISLGYVRSSNIYVRGYLDLRAWSLRLRAQIEKNHYVKALFLHEKDPFPSAGQEEYLRQGEGLAYLFGEAYRCELGDDALAP